MLRRELELKLYDGGVDRYARRAEAQDVLKAPPTDDTRTRYGKDRVIAAARRIGRALMGAPVGGLTELTRRTGLARALVECALACPPLKDGTPGPVSAGMIDVLIGRLYYDPAVPVYPEAIVVVRPTTTAPGAQTRRRSGFGLTRSKHQVFYTAFAQAIFGPDNRRDYALPIGAALSPSPWDLHHPPSDPELALAIERPADYLARHFGYVAGRIDALRHAQAIDSAWLFSENRIQLQEPLSHSMTASESETLARQPGFGQAFRRALGAQRVILVHAGDERSGGTGLYPALRYRPPGTGRLLTGEQIGHAMDHPEDPLHPLLEAAIWAWGPDLPGGVPTKVMAGELIDVRTDERFVLLVVNNGYYNIYLAMPYVDRVRPELSQLDLLRIALAVRAWEGDSPYLGRARRRSAEYVHAVNFPVLDPHTRVAAFFAGAAASARRMF